MFKVESAPNNRFPAAKTQRLEVSQKSYNCFSMLCASLCLRALAAILYFYFSEWAQSSKFNVPQISNF